MKFPKRIKYRGRELATIYGRSAAYPLYRVSWQVNGKRRMKAFDRFGGEAGANQFAETLVKDLAKGSQTTALSSGQASDALAALESLEAFRLATGKRVSLREAVSEYVESVGKLNGHTMREAVAGYLRNTASVKRKDVAEAVEEFVTSEEPRTKAKPGQRAQLSAEYARIRAILLRRFSRMFPGHAVSDLSKDHVDQFFKCEALAELSPKYRNHHRAALKQLLQWAVRKDYLSPAHRLNEADSMRPEHSNTADIEFYTAAELRKLLEASEGPMQAFVAIGALAGLRTAELLQLTWEDVWRVHGHIEVSKAKSKTRQRRLVEIVPALQRWLEPYRERRGMVWIGNPKFGQRHNENLFHKSFNALCEEAKVKRKENGLRHAFGTYHFALHSNENLTAAQAGNSPGMVHAHYKGLATKAEAEQWFAVMPASGANIVPMQSAV